jgi:hypothetical protein
MSSYNITKADFKLFLVIWNQRMSLRTPDIHRRMADWLERAWVKKDLRLLLMAFRSSGKSTIVGVFCAWLLYRDPNLRILVLSADDALAGKMVRNVKRILERHPLTPYLKPEKLDQWASDRFTVRRMLELRDPSMIAKGIGANITGNRADVIIYDDVEVPGTSDSAEKRYNLRQSLIESAFVLVPGGTQIYVGTPHTYYSIYAEDVRTEIGEVAPFLDGYTRLEIPLVNAAGESAWIEKFGEADIERYRKAAGPNKFSSQMMLTPMNIAEGRLKVADLNFYDCGMAYIKELKRLEINNREMVSASAWWDPSFGEKDGSVLAVVYTDAEGFYWLHTLEYLKYDNFDPADNATQQCRKVAFLAKLLMLPSLTLESNGIGKFLPQILRREMAKQKVNCSVVEHHSKRPKDIRILEAFDAVLAARALWVHADIKKTSFLSEMAEWAPGRRNRDDGLDAVAGALSLAPVRIGSGFIARKSQDWMRGAGSHTADTDFQF